MSKSTRIVILGAGPAGLAAAYSLTRRGFRQIEVIEQADSVGGIAASFDISGVRVDYGSHRLHPSCDPGVLKDLRELLGEDLLDRPRHGRIRLEGHWVRFPLKPFDLVSQLPRSFVTGVIKDLASKWFNMKAGLSGDESFASVLEKGLGKTICREFYFPYAKKIWGLSPEELAAEQAIRRVSAGSLSKMFRKVFSALPGLRPPGAGRFFYPRGGFGKITDSMCVVAQRAGALVHLRSRITAVAASGKDGYQVSWEENGKVHSIEADHVWSTIAPPDLLPLTEPKPPKEVIAASKNLHYRAMILIYLALEQERFTQYDAHYFPEAEIPITRLSEPKNYSDMHGPGSITVLCAELPCAMTDPVWKMEDQELRDLTTKSIESAGLRFETPVKQVVTRRLPRAYPIYRQGYEENSGRTEEWLNGLPNLLSFGRQGLFVHDNTHHALYMGYCASACLNTDGSFDEQRWQGFRRIFDTHVVED